MSGKRKPQIETGLQLLSRLTKRPSLEGLEPILFAQGPRAQESVEITGSVSSGKTNLLTQLIAKCILPSTLEGLATGGRGIAVVLINTDHHFRASKLLQFMQGIVSRLFERKNVFYSAQKIRDFLIPAMENLTIINCYENLQFKITLDVLDDILTKDPRIGFVALDSVSSFYWQNREVGGVWSIEQYLRNTLKIIQRYVFRYKIVLMYTRPEDFPSKPSNPPELADEPTAERINYRINLRGNGVGTLETIGGKIQLKFAIGKNSVDLSEIEQRQKY